MRAQNNNEIFTRNVLRFTEHAPSTADMNIDAVRQQQEDDDDLLALCDLVEEYKEEVGSLRYELSHTQLELQKADENLTASEVLVTELEDSIYYLDDDLSSKNELLQRMMCLLAAESPAEDILAGMSLVVTAYETGRDLDEVPLMASDGHRKEMAALRLHYEQLLSVREEELACARERERALSAANQQLQQERDRFDQRLRAAESSSAQQKNSIAPTSVGSDEDEDDDDDDDEKDREEDRDCKVVIPRRRKHDRHFPPDVPSPYRRPKASSDDAEGSPTRSRSRGAVVLQAIRSARARSVVVVAAAKDEGEERKDVYTDAPRSGGWETGRRGVSALAVSALAVSALAVSTATAGDKHAREDKTPPKAIFPHLSFSHPKFKRDAQIGGEFESADNATQGDSGDCVISPDDLRHGIRSYSLSGQRQAAAHQAKAGGSSGPTSPSKSRREQQQRRTVGNGSHAGAGRGRGIDRDDAFRPSSSGTQGRTDEEDDDDYDYR